MNYLSPVYIAIGAALFLGERLPPRRIAAVCFALLGAMIILRPGLRTLDAGHIAVACFATAGHFTMTLAFAAAPMTVTQPVTFLQLVWAVLLGCGTG